MNKIIFNIKKILKPLVRGISNKKIRKFIIFLHNKSNEYTYTRSMLRYYSKIDQTKIDPEKAEVLSFLKENPFNMFPYAFIKKYKSSEVKVFEDEQTGLKYSLLDGKKIYFKRGTEEDEARNVFNALVLVQDIDSPHRYLVNNFDVSEDDIVADIGAAEGDFALSIIERVKKVYLFEADPGLLDALQKTFEPWKEKVVIVNKYVSSKTGGKYTTLDDFFENKEIPTFLKIDIEGAEHDMIKGAEKVLSGKKVRKVVMASYHKHEDEILLSQELKRCGFETEHSKGYMLSIWDGIIKAPYMRRALIRARK